MIVSIVLSASIVIALVYLHSFKSKSEKQDDNGIKHKKPGVLQVLKSIYEMLFKVDNDGN